MSLFPQAGCPRNMAENYWRCRPAYEVQMWNHHDNAKQVGHHNSQIFRKLSWSPHLHNQMNKGKELYANIYWLEPRGLQPEETGKYSPLVKTRQISSYCRHILTFPAHLNFISRPTSSIVLEHSSGASSLKKQGNLHRWLIYHAIYVDVDLLMKFKCAGNVKICLQ